MIKLGLSQQKQLLEFLNAKIVENVFFLGNYSAYGFDNPDCEFWCIYDNDEITACIMRYHQNLHLLGNFSDKVVLDDISDLVKTHSITTINTASKDYALIMGVESVVNATLSVFYRDGITNPTCAEMINLNDVDEYLRLLDTIFKHTIDKTEFIDNLVSGRNRSYLVRKKDKIVSVGSLTAISERIAMIIGVGTLPQYREKGNAADIINALCHDLAQSGRSAALFYSNPKAGQLYKSLGFVDIMPYYTLKLKGA